MAWDVFSFIGTAAFAISGAIVAMEEEYDIFGVYILGMVTAFGGGAVRNVLIGVPVSVLWDQQFLFFVASILITIIFFFLGIFFPIGIDGVITLMQSDWLHSPFKAPCLPYH